MTVDEMLNEIYENLIAEMSEDFAQDDKVNETVLMNKIKSAYRDVKQARRYPSSYAESAIESDMVNYYPTIEAIARYDYGKIGGDNMSSYSSDGTSIHYLSRDDLFNGVIPLT